jgi:hypothetical protein
MGTAAVEPTGRFEAGSHQEFILTYTAGRFGIDYSGSIKVVNRCCRTGATCTASRRRP